MMAKLYSFTLGLLCFLLAHSSIQGELHRARTKAGYIRYGAGHESRLAKHAEQVEQTSSWDFNFFNLTTHTRETWVYSIVASCVVGLCGIFPLFVIPLEAGKALRKGAPAARLKLLLSFAVGGLLGDVFLHLLAEAWAHVTPENFHEEHMAIGLWVLAGLLCFLIIEKIFPDGEEEEEEDEEEEEEATHETELTTLSADKAAPLLNGHTPHPNTRHRKGAKNKNGHVKNSLIPVKKNGYIANGVANGVANGHVTNGHVVANGHVANGVANGHVVANGEVVKKKVEKKKSKEHAEHIKTSGWLNLMANVVDNFTHGLAVAGSFCVSPKVGMLTTFAILLHEIPHEIGDFAILLRSGFDRWRAAKCQILTASGGLIGAITALTAESAKAAGDRTAWILPFTSGGFIYIALVAIVPDLLKETKPWESVKQLILLVAGIAVMAAITIFFE